MIAEKDLKKTHCAELTVGAMNHCASICPHNNGVLICWYAGKHECNDKQSAFVTYFDGEKYSSPVKIGNATGNPVIWDIDDKKAIILYSKFENLETDRMVHRWMYCSNWMKEIEYVGGDLFRTSTAVKLNTDPEVGLLGRCQPIRYKNKYLIPMYREHNCYGEIFEQVDVDGLNYVSIGKIGESNEETGNRFGRGLLIQPTLWHDGSVIYSLSRDITKNKKAWFSKSTDGGVSWSDPETTDITSFNNSLVALHDPNNPVKDPLLMWNKTEKDNVSRSARGNMALGQVNLSGNSASGIGLLNEKGVNSTIKLNDREPAAYPNYCFDHSGNVHMVHSDHPLIKHHVFKSPQK